MERDLISRMRRELDKLQENKKKINNLVHEGVISERFGKYLEYFSMLNFSTIEAEAYAREGNRQGSISSLVGGRTILDSIASLYIEHLMQGEDCQHYQNFYELAKEKYENSESKCCNLLESN
ncbi:hypothetical protein J4221_04465 [Candidatus Pacearchaeota archaeon]|nr:hypothetical protein [Candidatus Pacearchaeota archaeon]